MKEESCTKTNVVRPDNADEESMQGVIMDALAHQDKEYKISDERVELDGGSRLINRKK